MVIRRNGVLALVAGVTLLAACGDDDPVRTDEPDLTRADVAGQYEMTALSFDPQGSLLDVVNLLARLDSLDLPQFRVSSNRDSVQLIFTDPVGGLLRTVDGTYDLGDDGISVSMENSPDPQKLLLPRSQAFAYDSVAETLSFAGNIQADTAHLFALVPEWRGEPVTHPLPGVLTVIWQRN